VDELIIREIDCADGKRHPVVDEFPDELLVSDRLLAVVDPHRMMLDAKRGRLWVSVYNGTAEYATHHDASLRAYVCARLYQDFRWAPPAETVTKPKPSAPTPDRLLYPDDDNWGLAW
jgi:hypothetical protein